MHDGLRDFLSACGFPIESTRARTKRYVRAYKDLLLNPPVDETLDHQSMKAPLEPSEVEFATLICGDERFAIEMLHRIYPPLQTPSASPLPSEG